MLILAGTANKAANTWLFNGTQIVTTIGAITVGILGNLYSRFFSGTAFTAMVTGVLFLVPAGLSGIGGLGSEGEQFSSGIMIGLRILQG